MSIIFFLYGICIGSFLNVCIERIPKQLSFVRGRSFCPDCRHALSFTDLIPLISFLALKGRCRYCQARISLANPLVESLTGILFVICYLVLGLHFRTVVFCLFGAALITAAGIDLKHTYIPDRINLLIVLLALTLHLSGQAPAWSSCISGSLVTAGFMLLVSFATNGGIGGGDIKLFAASGLLLGFGNILLAFFIGYVLAALSCLPLLLRKKLHLGYEIPMVPFFAVSLMAAALWGDQLIPWYLMVFI